jgi:hypothetical protein
VPEGLHSRRGLGRSVSARGLRLCENSEIPPTAVGGLFRSHLQEVGFFEFMNPTNGSWWIFQIQPVRSTSKAMKVENRFIWPAALFPRQDLNHPPTAVGGIQKTQSPQFVGGI